MTPTQVLKAEHEVIKLMLKVLVSVSEKLEAGQSVGPDHMEKMVDFIRTFADKCHHGKEEDLLFKAMEDAGVPREGGPIGVMLSEHEQGRGYVREMAEAAVQYEIGNVEAGKKFARNARDYVNLLSQHIDKEDNVLFKMADMHIPEEKQNELLELFEKVETEKIAPGKHEQYHNLVHVLEEVYLSGR